MADEKSLTEQFVDLQFYMVDQPQVRIKGYRFKERVAEFEQQLAQARSDLAGIKRLFEEEREGRIQYQQQAAHAMDIAREQHVQLAEAQDTLKVSMQQAKAAGEESYEARKALAEESYKAQRELAQERKQLKAEREALVLMGIQLTEAQKERDLAQDSLRNTLDVMTEMEAEANEMRALLERVNVLFEWQMRGNMPPEALTSTRPLDHYLIDRDITAYLAEHPAPAQLEDDDDDD